MGSPFGVGFVSFPVNGEMAKELVATNGVYLEEQAGRVFYPAFTKRPVLGGPNRPLLRGILGRIRQQTSNNEVTAFFLFRGRDPLTIRIQGLDRPREIVIVPRDRPLAFERFMRRWWRDYADGGLVPTESKDFPPIVETYLRSLLARRLQLAPPLLGSLRESASNGMLSEPFQLLLGAHSVKEAAIDDVLSGRNVAATLPSPPLLEGLPPPPEGSVIGNEVAIEPIASRVPEECFYIRFGSFTNYLWLTGLIDRHGGDARRMITAQGHDARIKQRMQRQLVVEETALARMFGDKVIGDMVIMGRDLFLAEGSTLGIVFEARNLLLGVELNKQRTAVSQESENATLKTIQIAGRDVSLLSTPGNEIRSYYVVDGKYHLVSNSHHLISRFLEAGEGKRNLAGSPDFRRARAAMPDDGQDTLFCYFSSPFFAGLTSTHYQAELKRRTRSLVEIELFQVAQLMAKNENLPYRTIAELVDSGILPRGFGRRADGSQLAINGESIEDSVRGKRGTFAPIPDMVTDPNTRQMVDSHEVPNNTAFDQSADWIDPMLVRARRESQGSIEQVTIDAYLLPFDAQKYGTMGSMLGPPTGERIAPTPGDVVWAQAVLRGGTFRPEVGVHHLFLGMQDTVPSPDRAQGKILRAIQLLQRAPGYLGAWPRPGLLDFLPLSTGGQSDPNGYSQLLLGLWRRQLGEFSVLSFSFPLLEYVTNQLRIESTENLAQFRLFVDDLSKAKVSAWIDELYYKRARQVSYANAKLLNGLTQQLSVPATSAKEIAERLHGVNLVCALDGTYRLNEGDVRRWYSTAWRSRRAVNELGIPSDYGASVLAWFRGLKAQLTVADGQLYIHANLNLAAEESSLGGDILNLLRGNGADQSDSNLESEVSTRGD